jgi:hypothetical protein
MKKQLTMNGESYIVETTTDGKTIVSKKSKGQADFGEVILVLEEIKNGKGTDVK